MTKIQKITKTTLLRQLLEQEGGATLAEICAATGWQAHSARASLTGLRKDGTTIERIASVGGQPTRWRIAKSVSTADAHDGETEPMAAVKA